MVKLSAKSRYAVQAMMFLAQKESDGPQSLGRITQCGLPRDYLEQLLGQLRRGGLVQSVRGTQGGYLLAKPARQITLGQVIAVIDNPGAPESCAYENDSCQKEKLCGIHHAWAEVSRQIEQIMDTYTLLDMLNAAQPAAEKRN